MHIGGAAPKNNSRASSTDGFSNDNYHSPPNKNVRKEKPWNNNNFDNQNFQQNSSQNITAGLLNALGNFNFVRRPYRETSYVYDQLVDPTIHKSLVS